MPAPSQSRPTRQELGSPAHIRRAERALQKDLRFMIRENNRRRARNEKGPGGVKRADEFSELRRAKLEVSVRAAAMVEEKFGRRAARMFRLRANVRMALSYVPDWAAKLVPRGAGRSNQSRHDEGQQNGPEAQDRGGYAQVAHPDQQGRAGDWVKAAETKNERRTAHTAAALSELMTSTPDLQAWYRSEPGALSRTRDLFAAAEQRHAEWATARSMADPYTPQYPGEAPVPQFAGRDARLQYGGSDSWSQYGGPDQQSQYSGPIQDSPIRRKPVPNTAQVSHVASLTSREPAGGPGRSATPPPVRPRTPRQGRGLAK